ncbi:MAG TPA: hypothetical protein VGK24_09620 [Candidatus Angelobacter sp.]|jgi:hypothetical protein
MSLHGNKNVPTTADDERAAYLIGLLMMVAKMSKVPCNPFAANSEAVADVAAEKMSREVVLLVQKANQFFPGGDMEQQVIAFARTVGFEIEQHYIGNASTKKH